MKGGGGFPFESSASCWVDGSSSVISYLSSTLASSILSTGLESRVEFDANDASIEFGATQVGDGMEGIHATPVFDKAKAAGRLLEAIEAHMDLPYDANEGEVSADMDAACGEGEVADIERFGFG